MKSIFSLPFLAALFVLALPVQGQKPVPRELFTKGFNTLSAAVKAAGLEETLNGARPFTLFAPNDSAFRDMPKAQLDALLVDKEKLVALINNHIVDGKLNLADLKPGKLKTVGGLELNLQEVDGKMKVGSATIVKPDVAASNGVIHGIDVIQGLP